MNHLLITILTLFLGASLLSFQEISPPPQRPISDSPSSDVRILAFGDLMLGRDVERIMGIEGEDYPFLEIFGESGLKQSNYDLITANLEGPIVKAAKRADLLPFFSFNPDIVPPLLKKWGFNLLNVANNHTWDQNLRGWESTLSTLHDQGISTVGHPKNLFDSDTYEVEIKGMKLGFMGISMIPFEVDWEEAKRVARELDARNDVVILMIHWGTEYKTHSNLIQRDKAHGMIENGIDLIIGHHPHVVQESEVFEGKPIYYSLGNFVFDQYFSEEVQHGLGLDIRIRTDGELSIDELPILIEKGQPRLQETVKNNT